MPYDPRRHHRRSIRLQGYDYTSPGGYFVTLCVYQRRHLFGEVVKGEMQLTPYGRVVDTYWSRIPRHFPHVELDAWVVMPDHFHGIIFIVEETARPIPPSKAEEDRKGEPPFVAQADLRSISTQPRPHGAPPGSLGAIVGNFKSITTRRINRMRHTPGGRVWLRNYWERIIWDERAYRAIRNYILNNPARWEEDHHPDAP
jgi:REP element-mobilizing transposase RayT